MNSPLSAKSSSDSAVQFVRQMAADIREGYHVVPFIGAGFSLGAGFPTTVVLAQHLLPYWIIRGLGINPLAKGNTKDILKPVLRRWSPRSGWWPQPGDEMLSSGKKMEPFSLADAIHQLRELTSKPDKPEYSEAALPAARHCLDQAQVALESRDWMKMVQFISRITPPSPGQRKITAGPERQSVVDSLFLHLNKTCEPSLGHNMLVALQSLWRCQVILTTNFDNLIETAFARSEEPLETFEIGKTSPLPDASLVLAQSSLVKLHGGRFDVRADITVASPLGREDIKNALSYVAGRTLFRDDILSEEAAPKDRVVVLFFGCGDQDERTISFAQYVRQHFKEAKAYWISFTPKTVSDIKTIRGFKQVLNVDYTDFGLLLLSLYEHLAHSVPPNGAIHPGPWQLSSPPRIPRSEATNVNENLYQARCSLRKKLFIQKDAKLKSAKTKLNKWEQQWMDSGEFRLDIGKPPLWLRVGEENYAAAAICLAFWEKRRGYNFKAIWIDLDEVTMPAGVLMRIVMMLHRTEGVIDPLTTLDIDGFADHARIQKSEDTILRALRRHHAQTGVPVLVFLNASEPPGRDALFNLRSEIGTNGTRWQIKGAEEEMTALANTLQKASEDKSCGIRIVYIAPKKRVGKNAMQAKVFDAMLKLRCASKKFYHEVSKPCTEFEPDKIGGIAIEWVAENKSEADIRRIFMLAIVSFRQSCYPSALARVLYSYQLDLPATRHQGASITEVQYFDLVAGWLEELNIRRVIRRKDGGFVWMNNRVKRTIREKIALDARSRVVLHNCIARWHARLLFSSSDPLAAKEGIYHHLLGVHQAIALLYSRSKSWLDNDEGICDYCLGMVDHARQMLSTSQALFLERIASSFADRSLVFLLEETQRVLSGLDKRSKRFSSANCKLLSRRLTILEAELTEVRQSVAYHEGQFRHLEEITSSGSPDVGGLLPERHASALLHLRSYLRATEEFQKQWRARLKAYKTSAADIRQTIQLWASVEDGGSEMDMQWICPRRFALKLRRADSDEDKAMRLVRLARWGVYLHLNRSQAYFVESLACNAASGAPEENIHAAAKECRLRNIRRSAWFFDFGTEMLRHCADIKNREVLIESIRLRAHGSLMLGLLNMCHGGRPEGAWRLHGDASSFLGGFPVTSGGVTTAIVSLRAAELCLIEAGSDGEFKTARHRLRLLDLVGDEIQQVTPNDLDEKTHRPQLTDFISREKCERLAVIVHESLHWLDKTESILVNHPKSRWWWSIFAVLKAKACEYLHILRLARAIREKSGHGLEPKMLIPSVFRFQDSGLLRLLVEKGLSDLFYLSRVLVSMVELYRCEFWYASLYPTEDPSTLTVKKQTGNSAALLSSRRQLIEHLISDIKTRLKVETDTNLESRIDQRVLNYAKACLVKADPLIPAGDHA